MLTKKRLQKRFIHNLFCDWFQCHGKFGHVNYFIFTGIDIHFVHVKPPRLPEGQSAKPLLMVHGWPGSFYEFYKIIPLLTDPASHGLSDEHIFEVICPSIPGYGFSEAPHKKGMMYEKKLN